VPILVKLVLSPRSWTRSCSHGDYTSNRVERTLANTGYVRGVAAQLVLRGRNSAYADVLAWRYPDL